MTYEKLSKGALGCMYTATVLGTFIGLMVLMLVNILWFVPDRIQIGIIISFVIGGILILNAAISPYFRYHRYRYSINEECIDIEEGYLFVKRNIVPIERLHKLQTEQGPIDRIFHVAKVKVTTAGGDVTIRFLQKEKAEAIAESLKNRINQIVAQQRMEDGREEEIS
ncbi:MAG: hypothetical protein E7253_02280 [Lachnospiraceae bacterium]|nr:hypothetical protein [Lachnospiraceae bacterium]